MDKRFQAIFNLALPYLKKGKRKDFVLHTREVIKAMDLLIKKEGGDADILVPAAIVHDAGWSKVPVKLQRSKNKAEKEQAMKLHLTYAPEIIRNILEKLKYPKNKIQTIIDIVIAHKYQNPKNHDKRMLIDADTMCESFKKQFYDDVKSYKNDPQSSYNYRMKNKFYTKTASAVFKKEMAERKKEIFR